MTASHKCVTDIDDPAKIDETVNETQRKLAEEKLGGPVQLLSRGLIYHNITVISEWTRVPEPPKDEPAPEA